MSDICDDAQIVTESFAAKEVESICRAAANMPKGEKGECDICGGEFVRLVGGLCGRCRDKRRLP